MSDVASESAAQEVCGVPELVERTFPPSAGEAQQADPPHSAEVGIPCGSYKGGGHDPCAAHAGYYLEIRKGSPWATVCGIRPLPREPELNGWGHGWVTGSDHESFMRKAYALWEESIMGGTEKMWRGLKHMMEPYESGCSLGHLFCLVGDSMEEFLREWLHEDPERGRAQDTMERTIWHWACYFDCPLLLLAAMDVTGCELWDKEKHNPMHYARMSNSVRCGQIMHLEGCYGTLHRACPWFSEIKQEHREVRRRVLQSELPCVAPLLTEHSAASLWVDTRLRRICSKGRRCSSCDWDDQETLNPATGEWEEPPDTHQHGRYSGPDSVHSSGDEHLDMDIKDYERYTRATVRVLDPITISDAVYERMKRVQDWQNDMAFLHLDTKPQPASVVKHEPKRQGKRKKASWQQRMMAAL